MEFTNHKAIYLQIADSFFENILSQQWKEGERIPSVREVAMNFEVTPNTAMRTFTYLQDKGVIHNKRGIGYFLENGAYKNSLELKKNEFLQNELPLFFNMIDLLKISFDELKEMYQQAKVS